jgi:protein TonB
MPDALMRDAIMQDALDQFEQREPLGKAFFGSVVAHGSLVAAVLALSYFHLIDPWGSPHASGGSVGVTMVKNLIQIPRPEGRVNPLANDTKSIVPQETMQVKTKPVEKAPDPKAIAIPDRVEKPKKVAAKPAPPAAVFKPEAYQANQVYSKTPQQMSSPMYGMQGAGGIDIGPASVLGNRCGAYVNEMRTLISGHWNQAGVNALPSQKSSVSFVLARSGAVSNIQIAQPSGSYLLDSSAKRAVIDASPLPALPPQCPGNDVPVTLWFQIQK